MKTEEYSLIAQLERNDYRCKTTGKLGFYSLDENINNAPYRVLLEIGDNGVSRDFLQIPTNQKIIGEAIKVTFGEMAFRNEQK